MHLIRRGLTWFGTAAAHPGAVLIWFLYACLWLIFEPETLDWHGAATLVTWFMTLLIQRAEHRDTQGCTPNWMSCSMYTAMRGMILQSSMNASLRTLNGLDRPHAKMTTELG